MNFLSVAIGGACGAMMRYAVALYVAGHLGAASWIATLSVNIAGCLCMGVLAGYLAAVPTVSEPVRLALTVGFLGAVTTFSTYALDSYTLFQRGDVMLLMGYIAGSVILSLLAFGVGIMLMRALVLS